MNPKIQTFAQLATNTSGQLTGSYAEWTHFLETAARLYKDVFCKRWMSNPTQYSIAAGSFVVKPTICRF